METTTKKQTKKEKAIAGFMCKLLADREELGELTIITYEPDCAVIFRGRGFRPLYHYRFKTAEDVEEFVNKEKEAEKKRVRDESDRLAKYAEEKKGFKVGAILYSSWGYEQTNIDFYIITERKKDFVILQRIGEKRAYSGDDRGSVVADPSVKVGEPFRKKISKYASVKMNSYSYCGLWDGKPKYFSCYA